MTSPQRIHALPLHLANQIAAGEVIERPASVVKELIENSLDAGANQITIHIDGAGSKLIKITDNGDGIHPEDLPLALSRHATSKLSTSEQLSHIASLGFRGEALPSIASISQLSLHSKQADNEHAWQYQATNDTTQPTTHPNGTTIEVRDLFFNVPARRRFLKGDKTEHHHILTTLNRLALSQFDVGFHGHFSNVNDLKLPVATTAEQRQQRVAKICGKSFVENSLYIEQTYDDIQLHGWIASTQGHRPQTDVHYFFINGRVIRDRVINHAIRQAYAELIPEGRYPAFVLYLTMPLDRVDINVHPTKHEVRFRDARLIHGLINKAISEALNQPQNIIDDKNATIPLQQASLMPEAQRPQTEINSTIDESKPRYAPSPSLEATANPHFGTAISLLAQRYLLTQKEDMHWLLDIQTAAQQLRQQQFQQAIESDSLSARPILVPIKLKLSNEQLDTFRQQQAALQKFGFSYALTRQQLQITTIPSLFAHSPLPDLFDKIASALRKQSNSSELNQLLQQLLPLIPIQSLDQALQIFPQKNELPDTTTWSRQLNVERLEELFNL